MDSPPFVMKTKNKSKTLEKISNQFWGVIYRFYNMSSKARKTQKSVLNLQNQSPRLLGPPFKISWIHHWNEVDVFYYRALRSSVAEINSKVKTSGILRNFEKIVIWSTHYFKGSMKLRSLNIISWKMISKIQKLILQINYDRPIGLSVVLGGFFYRKRTLFERISYPA